MDKNHGASRLNKMMEDLDNILKSHGERIKKYSNQRFRHKQLISENIRPSNMIGKSYKKKILLGELVEVHRKLIDIIRKFRLLSRETISRRYEIPTVSPKKPNLNLKQLNSFGVLLANNFQIYSANAQRGKTEDSISSSEANIREPSSTPVRGTRSANTNSHGNISTVTAAKEAIMLCIADLENVKTYLEKQETGKVDRAAGFPSEEDNSKEGEVSSVFEVTNGESIEVILNENDPASKLVICITGKQHEEGKIRIVLKKCSECLEVGKQTNQQEPKETEGPKKVMRVDEGTDKFARAQDPDETHTTDKSQAENEEMEFQSSDSKKPMKPVPKNPLNIKIDPGDPSTSVVEGQQAESRARTQPDRSDDPTTSDVNPSTNYQETPTQINNSYDQKMSRAQPLQEVSKLQSHPDSLKGPAQQPEIQTQQNYSSINLNESVNLKLSTETGDEFIISLKVQKAQQPKQMKPRISLRDIFSEDDENTTQSEQEMNDNNIRDYTRICDEKCLGMKTTHTVNRNVTLMRARICSSLDCNVNTMDSRMRKEGISHKNTNIVLRLTDLGVNNLLRACRPVKCGRCVVLNSYVPDQSPYSPSLMSLPLGEEDIPVINQSLEISLERDLGRLSS